MQIDWVIGNCQKLLSVEWKSLTIILEFQDWFCGILSESKFLLKIQWFMINCNEFHEFARNHFQSKPWILNTYLPNFPLSFCEFTKLCGEELKCIFLLLFLLRVRTMVLFKWLKLKLSVLSRSKEVLGFRWFDID